MDLREVFKEGFLQYSDELFRHASMRLKDRDRALELTQEAFLKAWEYAKKGEEIRELRPFLYRTLRHLIIDEYRKHKATSLEAMVENDEGGSVEALLPQDESNTFERAIERYDGKQALAALQELADTYREVFTMRYVEEFTIKEIAEAIEESENVVSVRLHRGIKKLREILEEKENQKNKTNEKF